MDTTTQNSTTETVKNTKAYNEGLTAEQVLSILKEAKGGSWYDGWVPYCIMRNPDGSYAKCSSPRMHKMPWGFKCPDCGNEIGFNLKRIEI